MGWVDAEGGRLGGVSPALGPPPPQPPSWPCCWGLGSSVIQAQARGDELRCHPAPALAPAREAVELYGELAAKNPDAFRPGELPAHPRVRYGRGGQESSRVGVQRVLEQVAGLGQRSLDPEHRFAPLGGRVDIAIGVPHDPVRAGISPQIDAGDLVEAVGAEDVDARAAIAGERDVLAIVAQGDEVLDWREMQAFCAGGQIRLLPGSDHAISDFDDHIDEVLRFLDLKN